MTFDQIHNEADHERNAKAKYAQCLKPVHNPCPLRGGEFPRNMFIHVLLLFVRSVSGFIRLHLNCQHVLFSAPFLFAILAILNSILVAFIDLSLCHQLKRNSQRYLLSAEYSPPFLAHSRFIIS